MSSLLPRYEVVCQLKHATQMNVFRRTLPSSFHASLYFPPRFISMASRSIQAKETAPVRVLVVGGGYGGLAAGLNLLDLCNGNVARFNQSIEKHVEGKPKFPIQVKFVDERDGYYHVIGSPLALCSEEFANKAWQLYADLPAFKAPEISFAQGSVVRIDPARKVATIKDGITGKDYEESYDYMIAATGLKRDWPAVPLSLTKEKYMVEAGNHTQAVRNANMGVVVIGGGAVGIEMAAEIAVVHPTKKVTLIHSRAKLLSAEPLPDDFKDKTVELLEQSGVEVVLGQRVTKTEPVETKDGSSLYNLTLSDGSTLSAGHVVFAVSHQKPISSYLPSEAVDAEGYVKVAASMELLPNLPNHTSHYAIGDICLWSGIKRCGAAMSMGYHAAHNIHQRLLQSISITQPAPEPEFKLFPEVPPMIAIAVGHSAIMLSPQEGTTAGKEVLEMMFRNDLGWAICWDYLQLAVDTTLPPAMDILLGEKETIEVQVIATAAKMEVIAV